MITKEVVSVIFRILGDRLSWTKAVTLEQVVDSLKLAKSGVLHVVLSHNNSLTIGASIFFTNQIQPAELELCSMAETQSQ